MGKPRSTLKRLGRNRAGNVMYMTAGLLLPAIACVGAGIDLAQAYMAKARLQQACDAGVLAGRRDMADGGFDSQARKAAEDMFEFNYPDDIYQSRNVSFTPTASGFSDIRGEATATVDTIIMHMFGKDNFVLEVDCTARLEIANTDIMFVLDTTFSMMDINPGDTMNRMDSVRTEVLAFYDTVAAAQTGGAQIRYGFMPYSSNVNVGHILRAADPSWIAESVTMPSRTVQVVQTGTSGPTTNNSVWSNWTTTWVNTGTTISRTSANCASTTPPGNSIANGTATTNVTNSGGNPQTETTTVTTPQTESQFRYNWNNSACQLQSINRTRSSTTTSSVTRRFDYTYRNVTFDTTAARTGGSLTAPTGDFGADVSQSWNGCIIERATVAFDDAANVPAGTWDLDIDHIPNSLATRWAPMYARHAFPRSTNPWDSSQSTANVGPTTDDYRDYEFYNGFENGNRNQAFSACPSEAKRLQEYTGSAGRAAISTYLNGLVPTGGTYHDVGMVWGTRFLSPTGLFAADNATATNGAPISRHIIFMTDGQMAPHPGILGFQNQEYAMRRVGSTSTTELTARHNARFIHACSEAKRRNITVWVVAFGTALSPQMTQCASSGNAYAANNRTQLRERFQQIARQITRLRLQQ